MINPGSFKVCQGCFPPPFLALSSYNPGCFQPAFAHLSWVQKGAAESVRMSTLPSETAWLCLAVTAALGGLILCQLKKSPGQVGRKVVCLVGLWGGACLLSLSLFWGLVLFSLSCFLLHIYLSGQEMLPVDQKAVLITGKRTTLQFSPRAGSGTCFASAGLFQIWFKNKMLGVE